MQRATVTSRPIMNASPLNLRARRVSPLDLGTAALLVGLLAIGIVMTFPSPSTAASWPYNGLGDDYSTPGCCHISPSTNVFANLCTDTTCSVGDPTLPGAPSNASGVTSSAAECCALCTSYQPRLPTSYGGLGCNAFTWCSNPSGCGAYASRSCFLKALAPGPGLLNPPLWNSKSSGSDWVSGVVFSDANAKCLQRLGGPTLHYCSEAFSAGFWRPDGGYGSASCHCINGCNHCAPGEPRAAPRALVSLISGNAHAAAKVQLLWLLDQMGSSVPNNIVLPIRRRPPCHLPGHGPRILRLLDLHASLRRHHLHRGPLACGACNHFRLLLLLRPRPLLGPRCPGLVRRPARHLPRPPGPLRWGRVAHSSHGPRHSGALAGQALLGPGGCKNASPHPGGSARG